MASPSLAIRVMSAVADNGPEFGRLNPICMASRFPRRHACRNAPPAGFEQSRQSPLKSSDAKPRKSLMQNPVSPPKTGMLASPQERARAVRAVLDKHGPEMDRRRELTQEVVDARAAQALLRLLLPKSMGGQEVPLVDYCKANEALAWADASTAWFVNQSNVSMATSAASMPHEAAAAMFGGPYAGLAWGARHDKSKAIRVEGGYRLTGTWSFASGGRHTRMLGAHSAVQNPDGTPHIRYGRPDDRSFVFLRSQARIIDDWHVLGLRGTGSDSYSVEDLFIPDAHAPARDVEEERREKGPLYPIGSTLLYASGFCSVTIGIARRMLDTYVTVAKGRHSRASPTAMASNQAIHREMAILEARLSATRAFLPRAAGAGVHPPRPSTAPR